MVETLQRKITQAEFLDQIASEIRDLTADVEDRYKKLSLEQLNWQPDEGKWSVAQCLDHIIQMNTLYMQGIARALVQAEGTNNGQARKPVNSNLWGKLFKKLMTSSTKMPTFKIFEPTREKYDMGILQEFKNSQQQLLKYVQKSKKANLNNFKVTSPASRFIQFKLGDILHIILLHEKRHLQQAQKVKRNIRFPMLIL